MASVGLACILKNEVRNIDRLLSSVKGCFESITMVDTGSTDGSIELLQKYASGPNPADTEIILDHFEWINDFSAARNYSFSKVNTDYIAWADLDDSLENREGFLSWKKEIMPIADYWLATYHYALDAQGRPICSFARERVMRRSMDLKWRYFVHEGVMPNHPGMTTLYVTNWSIKHHRTAEDMVQDKGRNLGLFAMNHENIDSRMLYYWGKELFDNGKHLEAYGKLVQAIKKEDLDVHDRILGIQYAATAAQVLKQHPEAIDLAIRGLQIAPTRAEFFTLLADSYVQLGKLADAMPYYEAAKRCPRSNTRNQFGFIYSHENAYGYWPRIQLARVKFQLGAIDEALKEAHEAQAINDCEESRSVVAEVERVMGKTKVACPTTGNKTADIVISCPPGTLYEWDEEGYQTTGYGGSETACIEMARHLHDITGRKVLVFNGRAIEKDMGGVSYRPVPELVDYMRENVPAAHIAWRHSERLTLAQSLVWSHDLFAPGMERIENYDKVLCLSEFHKRYVQSLFGVPEEKIIVTRNGINPKRWENADFTKVGNRVIFSSSPDRGLVRAMRVMDLVVKEIPDATLHAYYGMENLLKLGHMELVKSIQQMINERPWITFHGNVNQATLTTEMLKAKTWLYPTNFNETFCISAIECLSSKVYPVVRKYGALPHTLAGFPADIIDRDCESQSDIVYYAEKVIESLREDKWRQINVDPAQFSWRSVAIDWVELLGLRQPTT